MVHADDIRAQARDLLGAGKVRAVLGWRRGTAGALAEPVFVTDAQQAAELVWDPTCVHNLALFLVNEKKRLKAERNADGRPLAMIAKGCDSRAIVVLLQENHIQRGEVVVLGVSCESAGMVDPRKLERALRGRTATAVAFDSAGGVNVTTAEGETTLPAAEALADRCLECTMPWPDLADSFYGDKVEGRAYRPRFAALEAVAQLPAEERRAFWNGHFERCIRCYACRAVCPMCYCDECVVDSTEFVVTPQTGADEKARRIYWIQRSPDPAESAMYHLVRAMHLAGRCVDCAECERVCPVHIPVRLLNNVLEREAREAFDYVPGMDAGAPSLISSFRDGDPNDFVR